MSNEHSSIGFKRSKLFHVYFIPKRLIIKALKGGMFAMKSEVKPNRKEYMPVGGLDKEEGKLIKRFN